MAFNLFLIIIELFDTKKLGYDFFDTHTKHVSTISSLVVFVGFADRKKLKNITSFILKERNSSNDTES